MEWLSQIANGIFIMFKSSLDFHPQKFVIRERCYTVKKRLFENLFIFLNEKYVLRLRKLWLR